MAAAEKAGFVALIKKVRERLGGGPDAIAVLRASPPEHISSDRRTVAP
jgi:hypothetical protein